MWRHLWQYDGVIVWIESHTNTLTPHTHTLVLSTHSHIHADRDQKWREGRNDCWRRKLNSTPDKRYKVTRSVWKFVTKCRLVALCTVHLALNPCFLFRISIFLQSCKTKSGTESLDSRLGVHHHSNLVSIETGN